MPHSPPALLARRLLAWYDKHARRLPWRAAPGERADPYRVWLSEVMLQQTTVAAVEPYFRAFTARWPDRDGPGRRAARRSALGLGRAGLLRPRPQPPCLRQGSRRRGGGIPNDEDGLRALPGMGEYTAAAIAAIAFGQPRRGGRRQYRAGDGPLFAERESLPGAKPLLAARAETLTPTERAGDYAQAVMDLGATICTPRKPACGLCPWREDCAPSAGHRRALPARAPSRTAGTARHRLLGQPNRGAVLLRRRPDKGLLGGMMEIPSTPWRAEPWPMEEAMAAAPLSARWRPVPGVVEHVFTHFSLELGVVTGRAAKNHKAEGEWCAVDTIDARALPSVMKKVVRHALAGVGANA